MNEIAGYHFVFGIAENTLQVGFAGFLHGSLNLGERGLFDGLESQVNHRNGRNRNAERHTGQFAFDFGQYQADGLGGTGGRGDNILSRSTAAFPVFLGRAIDGLLGCGISMNRGHQTFGQAEAFFEQHMHDRG